ncbi:MAG: transglutaminase domain-containing protein [Planctomycetota bacterium]|jgi:hypothetical protein
MSKHAYVFLAFLAVLPPANAWAVSAANGDFENADEGGDPRGWRLDGPDGCMTRAEGEGEKGSAALRIEAPEKEFVFAGQWIKGIGEGEKVFVECRARCEKLFGYAGAWIIGKGTKDYQGSDLSLLRGDKDWLTLTIGFTTSPGFQALYIKLGAKGPGKVWFDNVEVRVGSEAEKASADAGLNPAERHWGIHHVQARYRVEIEKPGIEQVVILPLPMERDGQAPLAVEVTTDPPHALKGWKTASRTGPNRVARVTLAGGRKGQEFRLILHGYVLATLRDYKGLDDSLPLTRYKSLPRDVKVWLRSSSIVQARSSGIKKQAKKIQAKTLGELVAGLGRVMGEIEKGYEREFGTRWDAVSGLSERTGCCGAANLAAALLRARGVPARILAGYPAWSSALATHYVVEYYAPGFGWVLYDSASGLDRAHPCRQIHVSEVTLADEKESKKRAVVTGQWFWFGVPAHSVTEIEGEMAMLLHPDVPGSDGETKAEHLALIHRAFSDRVPAADQKALCKKALARWSKLLEKNEPDALRVDPRLVNAKDAKALGKALGK